MSINNTLINIENLKISFYMRQGIVRAVDGVSFQIKQGSVVGLVGESGCGKSVTTKSVLRIEAPGKIDEGKITLNKDNGSTYKIHEMAPNSDEIRAIRGNEISMIFQEPMTSFSPMHSIGNQICEAIYIHRNYSKEETGHMAMESLKSVGMSRPELIMKQYPHQLSGGMRQRVMIAMALCCEPKLLIADEPTTALDVTTEAQILELLNEKKQLMNMTILYISHNLAVISQVADEVVVMYLGQIVEQADVETLFYKPKHPYTQALLKSIPQIHTTSSEKLEVISGNTPDPYTRPSGCYFHQRCSYFDNGLCDETKPPMYTMDDGSKVACHLYNKNN